MLKYILFPLLMLISFVGVGVAQPPEPSVPSYYDPAEIPGEPEDAQTAISIDVEAFTSLPTARYTTSWPEENFQTMLAVKEYIDDLKTRAGMVQYDAYQLETISRWYQYKIKCYLHGAQSGLYRIPTYTDFCLDTLAELDHFYSGEETGKVQKE